MTNLSNSDACEAMARVMDDAAAHAASRRDEHQQTDPAFARKLHWWSEACASGAAFVRGLKDR